MTPRMWAELKVYIMEKRIHSKQELLDVMVQIEISEYCKPVMKIPKNDNIINDGPG